VEGVAELALGQGQWVVASTLVAEKVASITLP